MVKISKIGPVTVSRPDMGPLRIYKKKKNFENIFARFASAPEKDKNIFFEKKNFLKFYFACCMPVSKL